MCKVGDIIIIDQYKDNGMLLNKHSFVTFRMRMVKSKECHMTL